MRGQSRIGSRGGIHNLELLMSHYADDAVFMNPAVSVAQPGSNIEPKRCLKGV